MKRIAAALLFLAAAFCLVPATLRAQDDGAGLPRVRPLPGLKKKGPGMRGPGAAASRNRFDAIERMTPEQQERFLNSLPPDRRAQARRRLEAWKSMSSDERERVRQEYSQFRVLPAERQQRIRELFAEFTKLPPRRRVMMRREVAMLRQLDPDERAARINAEEFRNRFSADEHHLLTELSELLPRAKDAPADEIE